MIAHSVVARALVAIGFFAWVAQAQAHITQPSPVDPLDCYFEAHDVAYDLSRLTVAMPDQYRMTDIPTHERLNPIRERCEPLGFGDEVESGVMSGIEAFKNERAELAAAHRRILEQYNPSALAPARIGGINAVSSGG